jgi:hypothetical protein
MNRLFRAAGSHMNTRGGSKGTFMGSPALVKLFELGSWFEYTRKQGTPSGKH